jgi:2-C-methyl-D-erythritol 4-phosphate cytidylyltransferase
MLTYAIVPAAGRGVRMGQDKPKLFLDLLGKPLLLHTLQAICRARFVHGIMIAAPGDLVNQTRELVTRYLTGALPIQVITGGKERQDSVFNALLALPTECGWVMIHDGARPFASVQLLEQTWVAARETGAAIAAIAATDTIKRVELGQVRETLPREQVWLVQTPQVFRADLIRSAYHEAARNGWAGTDDASLVERLGVRVSVVPGERSNIKVTTAEDLLWARWFLNNRQNDREV